jgi:hypothetical protein
MGVILIAGLADARPETIRAGESYYSDEYAEDVEQKLVRDLGTDKNYEEVYQHYAYYEAIYDAQERVIVFIEYKRGEVLRREEYAYAPNGALSTRTVKRPGHPPDITRATQVAGEIPPTADNSPDE